MQWVEFPIRIFGPPHAKKLRFAGYLPDWTRLQGACSRTRPHVPLRTPEAVRASADYPPALCEAYAEIVVEEWLRR
eukprot:9635937-Lingulodinium_polyedra.AAC.1